ncbi:MAG: solanesyl diphosphate synthase [Gloeomargarita sp. SKYG116]|nr:solanesyl diphosphate synthase [Gloeomargarita sp. SKYG116]MCS7225569.1 solanesyl diphosphate synthase [Gloeomargarita sp. SKYB31]MDW8401359.1 solanesyl diphosphate synthase [Gloeomargarita sp. SKYGB_i_bin116]
MTLVTAPFAPIEDDLQQLSDHLRQLVGGRHPILSAAAEYLFGAGGKRLRPALVLLVAKATAGEVTMQHRRLAEITEMIHTASLVHDDVVDGADMRRNVPTVHTYFGNRVAILAGDYLFAQSSWYLANLDNLTVVKLLSRVIMDFAEGEIRQSMTHFDPDLSFEEYIEKTFLKTASLMAASCKAAAVLSNCPETLCEQMYQYGRYLGLAFQVVDDIFDFTASSAVLGKPAGADLQEGNLTAPVLFALQETPALRKLVERKFSEPGDLEQAVALVRMGQGIERSRQMAQEYAQMATTFLTDLPPSPARQSLWDLTDYVLSRLH